MFWIIDEFYSISSKFKDNVCVAYYNGSIYTYVSYKQVTVASDLLKGELTYFLESYNLSGKNFVGVLLEPQGTFPAIILGILKCKAPFICFDVNNMVKESIKNLNSFLTINMIITEKRYSELLKYFPSEYSLLKCCKLLNDDIEIWGSGCKEKRQNIKEKNYSKFEFLYAVQTSGTTGQSKIVKVPENCIIPNILHLRELFQITSSDVIYFSSPVTFDPCIVELFLSLTSGATLFIIKSNLKAAFYDVFDVLFPIEKVRPVLNVTVIQTTPSLFLNWPEDLVKERIMNDETCLRVLALGGEKCPSWEVTKKYQSEYNNTKVHYLYGITEVSCWASVHSVQPGDDGCNLGDPLLKTILEVRRDDGTPIHQGTGEMYIGSSSRVCIIGNECFENLQLPLFRSTGDIVKVHNKKYFYLGRKDSIIKRWGHRVCLSEVEKCTSVLSLVKQCTCLMDEKYGLILFVVLQSSEQEYINNIRAALKLKLNPASVPDVILCVNEIPYNNHGKINKTLLKSILYKKSEDSSFSTFQQSSTISKDDLVIKFKEIWKSHISSEYLPLEKKSTDFTNDFQNSSKSSSSSSFTPEFDRNIGFMSSGGDSISAIVFVSDLSHYIKVPNWFIGMLLKNSSFNDCLESITNLYSNIKEYETKDLKNYIDDNRTSKIEIHDISYTDSDKVSTSVSSNTNYDSTNHTVKRQKLNDVCNTNILYTKCKGRIIMYSFLKYEFNLIDFNKINLKLKWKYNLRKCVDASPTLVSYKSGEKFVLVGSHSGDMAVLNLSDGKIISMCHLPDRIESSPLVSEFNNSYFVGCYDRKVYCIDINSGMILWNFSTSDMVKSTPVSKCGEKSVIVGSYDHNLYCLCSETGKEMWCYKGTGSFSSMPFVVSRYNRIVASSLDGMCIVLDFDTGALVWKYKLSSPVFASPVVYRNNVIFAEVVGTLYCFDLNTGILQWKFNVNGNIFSSLTLSKRENETLIIFGCHDNFVYCLSVDKKPEIVWKTCFDSSVFSTPFVTQIGTAGLVAACSTKGIVYLLNLNDGNIIVSYTMPGEIFSSPIIEENSIIFGCRDNNIYCMEIN